MRYDPSSHRFPATHSTRLPAVVGCLTAAGLFGCEAAPQRNFSSWDSAGITIAESTARRWGEEGAWRVDSVPLLDLTQIGKGEPYEFYDVRDALRLPDGSIAVAESSSDQVRFFSSAGEFLGARGRTGEGPGEFQQLTSIEQGRGDSLVVFDARLQRITVLSLEGDGYRIISLRLPGTFVSTLFPLQDSTFLARIPGLWVPQPTDGLYRKPDPLVRLDSRGEILDTLAVLAGYEEFQWLLGEVTSVPLFGKNSHYVVSRDRVYFGDSDRMEIGVFLASGELERIVRVPGFDLTLPTEEIAQEREARLGPDPTSRRRDIVAALPTPERRPAYCSLVVDSEGCVWAEKCMGRVTRMMGGGPSSWTVFSPEGEWLGETKLPARFFVFEIGSDYVLGKRYDELDLEHVELLHLRRR